MIEPIFILGNPRSGTSLLRSLINSHENVVIPPECGFLQFLYKKYSDFRMSELENFLDDLFKTKKFEGWFIDRIKLHEHLSEIKPKNYQELIYNIYSFYGESKNKKILSWGDKNNYYINHLNEIDLIFPKSKFIHIIRNPYDVVYSYLNVTFLTETKYKPKFSSDVVEIVKEWIDNNNKVSVFLKQRKKDNVLVYYENLITDSDNEIKKIFDFIGLSHKDVINNFNSKKFFDEPEITMDWKKKLKEYILSDNFGLGLNNLEDKNILKIKEVLLKEKILFNYQTK